MRLLYEQESSNWNEALPIGNGFLGGMIWGTVATEKIQMNEDSLWSGERKNRINPNAKESIPKVRQLLFEGRIREAQQLTDAALFAPNPHPAHYEPLGDLDIRFGHGKSVTNYQRGLCLDNALSWVSYEIGGVTYTREFIANFPSNVICIKLAASTPGALSFKVDFSRGRALDAVQAYGNNKVVSTGRSMGENGVSFASMFTVVADGGTNNILGGTAIVENSNEAYIYFTARTDWRNKKYVDWCSSTLDIAVKKGYEELKTEHLQDYHSLYKRVSLNFGVDTKSDLPTDKRLAALKEGETDNGLFAMYYQFGRYLLISSSRPGTFAANLQGIWNKEMFPPWGSKYTININIQMNYWLAENCNLSELHEPLFDLIEKTKESGSITAREMYGCRGFVAHHNTDMFGDTAPVDKYMPSTIWQTGIAWFCTHIWEHYLFTQNKSVLEKYYDTMKEACLFFVDFLVEDPKGRLVTNPSLSPENTYILPNGESGVMCYAPSMDSQIIADLFGYMIKIINILYLPRKADKDARPYKDAEFSEELERIIEKLPKPEIGKHGQLMEWAEDYDEKDMGHRHISHLYALYPASQISPADTPELAKAARVTLDRRLANGGGHTGWSRAWIINFWARLLDADKTFENLTALLTKSTLPNLLDNHPPFQIDGNFGGAAGIAEMLLQSHNGKIAILPALPAKLPNGAVSGLCARGGFEVSFKWKDGMLKSLEVLSKSGLPCAITINRSVLKPDSLEKFEFKTVKGMKYIYKF